MGCIENTDTIADRSEDRNNEERNVNNESKSLSLLIEESSQQLQILHSHISSLPSCGSFYDDDVKKKSPSYERKIEIPECNLERRMSQLSLSKLIPGKFGRRRSL